MQAILLAAGRGTRFGADKLLHSLTDGTPMALAAVRNLKAAIPNVLAVVNGENLELMALLEEMGVGVSVCPDAAQGMGASLAWGVARSRQADGWLIALADMPWIRPETIHAVAKTVTGTSVIAAPVYRGRRGHPVAFGRGYGAALMALSGDEGARSLLAGFSREVILLPCEDSGVVRDIDLPEGIPGCTREKGGKT
jgi:molybdenum cofactor cytidylyltransferase